MQRNENKYEGHLAVKLPPPYLKTGKVATSSSKEGLDSRAANSIASQPWSPGRAFWTDVWKVLRLLPGPENKLLITWQCLPRVQQGACWQSTPHVLAVSRMTATARSLLCSQTSHQSLCSVKTNSSVTLELVCAPLQKTHFIFNSTLPPSSAMVQNTSMSSFREREVCK